eukprot:4982450-Lingulodinium_polyedra.AAC.1
MEYYIQRGSPGLRPTDLRATHCSECAPRLGFGNLSAGFNRNGKLDCQNLSPAHIPPKGSYKHPPGLI